MHQDCLDHDSLDSPWEWYPKGQSKFFVKPLRPIMNPFLFVLFPMEKGLGHYIMHQAPIANNNPSVGRVMVQYPPEYLMDRECAHWSVWYDLEPIDGDAFCVKDFVKIFREHRASCAKCRAGMDFVETWSIFLYGFENYMRDYGDMGVRTIDLITGNEMLARMEETSKIVLREPALPVHIYKLRGHCSMCVRDGLVEYEADY